MKNKLLFILSMLFIMPCMLLLTACDGDPDHTHIWSSEWSKTATEHYKTCTIDGCNETSERANHTDNPCIVCGYTTLETVNARDLKVYTYQTEHVGIFTVVELPDGKNMLIDSGTEDLNDNFKLTIALKDNYELRKIDYLILTNTVENRCGGVKFLQGYYGTSFVVDHFYYLDTIGVTFMPSTEYTSAITTLQDKPGCTHHTITDTSDITNIFLDTSGNIHEYTIDFMLPVAKVDCTDEYDYQAMLSIEYKDKIILLTGDATNKNIDGYIQNQEKDVDVLITRFNPSSPYAIVDSGLRNSESFIVDIVLESGDFVIFNTFLFSDGIEDLHNHLLSTGATCKSFANGDIAQYIVTISCLNGSVSLV